jgi:hypothetical protein
MGAFKSASTDEPRSGHNLGLADKGDELLLQWAWVLG